MAKRVSVPDGRIPSGPRPILIRFEPGFLDGGRIPLTIRPIVHYPVYTHGAGRPVGCLHMIFIAGASRGRRPKPLAQVMSVAELKITTIPR